MDYQRGDVVLVLHRPATQASGRASKTRPVVVVSSGTFHSERPQDTLAALVTTKVPKYQGATDCTLQDWKDAGLHRPSVVRATLATIELSQLGSKVGRLTDRDLAGVDAALREALGLPESG